MFYQSALYVRQIPRATEASDPHESLTAFKDLGKCINVLAKRQCLHFHLDLWVILIDQHSFKLHYGIKDA